jgi:hypothetical protein
VGSNINREGKDEAVEGRAELEEDEEPEDEEDDEDEEEEEFLLGFRIKEAKKFALVI